MSFLKSVFIGFLGIILSMTGIFGNAQVLAVEKIESGIYEIKNDVYHDSEIGISMARNYLNETMQLKVLGDEIEYIIGFSGTEYMENFRILVDGEDSNAEIIEENKENGIIKLKVKVPNKDSEMEAKIYVGPMERDVQFKVIPKFDTLTLVEKLEYPNKELKEEEKSTSSETEDIANEVDITTIASDGEEKSNIGIYVGGGVILVALIAVLVIAKRKK
ncbi:NEAT domain-containing protein [Clostridium sp. B9]|uniref:NEAT domain-containing protein n=1 Tax=Clostridium sp. B9 TaxID=3423224 RepID=UPI003D2EAE8B